MIPYAEPPLDEVCLAASSRVAALTLEAAATCGDPRLTVALCAAALPSTPRSTDLIRLAIRACHALDDVQGAGAWARKGLALDPLAPDFLASRAFGLELSGEFDLAAVLWRRAGALAGDASSYRFELGRSLLQANASGEAVKVLRALHQDRVGEPSASHSLVAGIERMLGEAQLKSGDLAGFKLFEARDRFDGGRFEIDKVPTWRGEALAGKTLMITHHLGLGDQLMLAPIASVLARRSGMIALTCEQALHALFSASFPGLEVMTGPRPSHIDFPPGIEMNDFVSRVRPDFHASLLGAFAYAEPGEILEAFAQRLVVPAAAQSWGRWQSERLRRRFPGKRLIGLAFDCIQHRLPFNAHDRALARRKSVPREIIEGLTLRDDVVADNHFVILHPPEHREIIGPLPGNCSAPHGDFFGFDQTAALLTRLDGLISVDTSVANLAAALGAPAQLLLSAAGDWRWGEAQTQAPWHPHIHLHRQPAPGAWGPVLTAAADGLMQDSMRAAAVS